VGTTRRVSNKGGEWYFTNNQQQYAATFKSDAKEFSKRWAEGVAERASAIAAAEGPSHSGDIANGYSVREKSSFVYEVGNSDPGAPYLESGAGDMLGRKRGGKGPIWFFPVDHGLYFTSGRPAVHALERAANDTGAVPSSGMFSGLSKLAGKVSSAFSSLLSKFR